MKEGNEKSLHDSLTNMEAKYETEKKEMRIASLEEERRLYIWLGVAGVLLAIALLIVLWQTKRNAQKEKELTATRSVLEGEMKERTRIANELHDRLGGTLSATKIGILVDEEKSLQNIHDKLDICIAEVRRVSHNLMPVSLQYGLRVALDDFIAQFPDVRFHFFGEERRIEKREEFVVYCCASELVYNSRRHSGAKNIHVQLVQSKSYISLTVQDDGSGFNEKTVKKGLGLKSVYDRVLSCNGKIDIVSSPDKGTEITIEFKTGKI